MGRTESFYTDSDGDKALSDPYLLERHNGKKTAIVNAALKEYFKNHRPDSEKIAQMQVPQGSKKVKLSI